MVLTILLVIAGLPAIGMVAMTMSAVVGRYFLNAIVPQADELQLLGFAWAVTLAIGAALAWRHAPMAAALSQWRPPAWQRIASGIVALVTTLCFAALAVVAAHRLGRIIAEPPSSDFFPIWPNMLGAVVGFALAAAVFLGVAVVRFRGWAPDREPSQ